MRTSALLDAASAAAAGLLTAALVFVAIPAEADDPVLDDVIYLVSNPGSNATLLTPYSAEAQQAVKYGFSVKDERFMASHEPRSGLTAAKRFYKPGTNDFATELLPARQQELVKAGYQDQGVRFYASAVDTPQTEPVYRYLKGTKHSYAVSAADRSVLATSGWAVDGVAFYAALTKADTPAPPPPTPTTPAPTPVAGDGDGRFSIAVIPDSQNEAQVFEGDQYLRRMRFIAGQRAPRDLRFIAGTGDLISWGGNETEGADPAQLSRLADAFKIVDGTGLPYLNALGNHDSAAVCKGGSACPSMTTQAMVNAGLRDTRALNRVLAAMSSKAEGAFEAGKVENSFRTFSAEGRDWLVLTVELTPRQAALDWAKQVVATHPKHNVIVLTHYLLEDDGSVATGMGNAPYGDLPPSQVYSQLILAYPNVVAAFSGHRGEKAAYRVDAGAGGRKVPTFIGALHSLNFNPTRFVTFDVKAGTITTHIKAASIRDDYARAFPKETLPGYDEYDTTVTGITFVNR